MVIQINVRIIHEKGQLSHKLQLSQDPLTPHLSTMQIYSSEGKLSSWSTKDTWAKMKCKEVQEMLRGGGRLASGLVETDFQRLFVGVDTFSLISGEQQRNAR